MCRFESDLRHHRRFSNLASLKSEIENRELHYTLHSFNEHGHICAYVRLHVSARTHEEFVSGQHSEAEELGQDDILRCLVRVKPFKPASKSFTTRAEADEWAKTLETTLRAQRRQNNTAPNLSTYTIARLAQDYLDDPTIKALKYLSELENYLAWWVNPTDRSVSTTSDRTC